MSRVLFSVAIAFSLSWIGVASADDTKDSANRQNKQQQDKHCLHATITKVSPQKDSITVKSQDKSGKEQEQTFQLSKDIAYRDSSGQTAKLADFKVGDDVLITQKDGKITEIKEDDEATITKVDPKAGTVTLKMKGKDGKDVEKVFQLMEDAEYIDSNGRVATLDVFRSGDQVLLIESEGRIKELKKSSDKKDSDSTAAKPRRDDNKSNNK